MKRCRHETWTWNRIVQGIPNDYVMSTAFCGQCDETLPLGPARDDGEHAAAVAVEVRAAEIAADYAHNLDGQGPELPQCADNEAFEERCERCGWEDWLMQCAEPKAKWHAGYLARCIATHGDE